MNRGHRLAALVVSITSTMACSAADDAPANQSLSQVAVEFLAPSGPETYQAAVEAYATRSWQLLEPGWAECIASKGTHVDPEVGYERSTLFDLTVGLGWAGLTSAAALRANAGANYFYSDASGSLAPPAAEAAEVCATAAGEVLGGKPESPEALAIVEKVDARTLAAWKAIRNARDGAAATLVKANDVEAELADKWVATVAPCLARDLMSTELAASPSTALFQGLGSPDIGYPTSEQRRAAVDAARPRIDAFLDCAREYREEFSERMAALRESSLEEHHEAFSAISRAFDDLEI